MRHLCKTPASSHPLRGPRAARMLLAAAILAAPVTALAQGVGGIVRDEITNSVRSNISSDFFRATLDVRNHVGGITGINLDGSGHTLTILVAPSEAAVWNVETGTQVARVAVPSAAFAAANAAGSTIVAVSQSGDATAYSADGKTLAQVKLSGSAVGVLFAADGKAFVATNTALAMFDPATKSFAPLQGVAGRISAIGPGGQLGDAALSSADGSLFVASPAGAITPFGKVAAAAVQITGCNNARAALLMSSDGSATLADGQAGTPAGKIDGRVFAVDSACKLVASGGANGAVTVVDRAGAARTPLVPMIKLGTQDGDVTGLYVNSATSRVISSEKTGLLRIWDLQRKRDVLQIYLTGRGWAVIDQNGRFDGSEEGMLDVGWLANSQRVTLDQFSDRYFEPGLMSDYMSGEASSTNVPTAIADGMFLPPKITLQVATNPTTNQPTMIIAVAEDQGGGVGDISLYHNGKLVPAGALLQKQAQTGANGKAVNAAAFAITPSSGVNTFVATAPTTKPAPSGAAYSATGRSEELSKSYAGGANSTLYILSVGVNAYRDPANTLQYAVPDAISLSSALETQNGKRFKNVVKKTLLDGQATLQNIRAALADLGTTKPDDVVVIYLAGHGEVLKGDWNFLPTDGRFGTAALTATALRDALVSMPAQRVLLMIDSCESGESATVFNQNRLFEARFLRELSRGAGIAVLAGARPDQGAAESAVLGHGLFTAAVLAGMDGAADTAPHDGQVTAHEITRYTGTEMRVLLQKLGAAQTIQQPAAFALGADFTIH